MKCIAVDMEQNRLTLTKEHGRLYMCSLTSLLMFHRFLVDSDVVGCCWIELPKDKYRVREEKSSTDTDSQTPGKVGVAFIRRVSLPTYFLIPPFFIILLFYIVNVVKLLSYSTSCTSF